MQVFSDVVIYQKYSLMLSLTRTNNPFRSYLFVFVVSFLFLSAFHYVLIIRKITLYINVMCHASTGKCKCGLFCTPKENTIMIL